MMQLSAEDRKKKTRHRQPKSKEGKSILAVPPGQDDKDSASEEPIKRKRKSRAEIQVPHHLNF